MRELEDKRTVFSKTFDLGEGRRRLEIGQLPMHFERDGALHDIDLTPEFDAGRKNHAVRDCPYSLRIADDRPAYFYNARNGKSVEVELSGVSGKPIVEGGLFKWAEVGRDTDYVIQPLPHGCSTLLILNTPEAPRKWSWAVDGDIDLIVPLVGKDSGGRRLELIETRDRNAGVISVEWTGRTVRPLQLRQAKRPLWTEEVTWPAVIDPTVNEAISANGDDVGSLWAASGASFAAFYSGNTMAYAGASGSVRAYAGLRFQTVPVPAAATINSASLTMFVGSVSGTANLNIFGNDVDDAAAWADPGNRVKNITKTSAVVNKSTWTPGADNAVDVSTVVAEVVARAGWAANNDIAFGLFNNTGGTGILALVTLEHATLAEARLSIDYSSAGASIASADASTAGAGTAFGAGASQAATVLNASGAGAASGASAAIAASVFSASGSGTLSAVGATGGERDAAASASGTAVLSGVATAIASASFSASSSGTLTAVPADTGLEIPALPDYTPVGGGGGFGPAPRQDNKRFRTRKDKSRPKVITVKIGDWPENPQIILSREEEAERESFYRRVVNSPAESVTKPVDEEEQALMEILAFAA
jgi:hypothetical protein